MPKISALPAMTTADGNDPAPIVDDSAGSTKKITLTKMKEWLQSLTSWITTAMITDANVTPQKWTNPYRFRVSRNAAANTGAAAFAKVTFDTEQYDTNNNFATGTYTVPIAGDYHFAWRLKWVTGGAEQFQSALYKNGVAITVGINESAAGVAHVTTMGVDSLRLAANDTMDVYAYNSGAAKAIEVGVSTAFLSGFLISI